MINFQDLMQQWTAGLLQITHPIDNARACDPISNPMTNIRIISSGAPRDDYWC
ncbi:MAG TPA: hypothetical protein VKC60_18905 [Opitutaceae bacterium]|nr:hypothetical protein [Opitutaceae bacterium]